MSGGTSGWDFRRGENEIQFLGLMVGTGDLGLGIGGSEAGKVEDMRGAQRAQLRASRFFEASGLVAGG